MIPYGRQAIDDDDIEAVVKVLRGDWLTQGPAVDAFEEALAATVDARYAVVFANGTAALHAACAAAGLGAGDVVATSALTFAASAACAHYVGARSTLVDIDPATLNLDAVQVPADADAIVAVHYAGLPIDLEALPHRPRVVIEDAAHAIGARTPDGPVGNCAHSDMTAFSFHPVKTITSGEGGAVTTNDPELADRLRRFRHHGIVKRDDYGPWCYEIPELGVNYRLTDIQAALGLSQLGKLDRFVARRNEIAARYREGLAGFDLTLAPEPPDGRWVHGRHLYPIRVADRDRVAADLRARGVGTQVHYVPVYRHRAYHDPADGGPERFPATEAAVAELLSLPMYAAMTDADVESVIGAVAEVTR